MSRFGPLAFAAGLWVTGVGIAAPALKDDGPRDAFVAWALARDFDGNGPHNPLVVGDKVVVGTDQGDLRAYRCRDGTAAWTVRHGQRIFHCPATDGERVYFTSATGLTAVNAADGSDAWSFPVAACDGPVLVLAKQGLVCVGGHDGTLYAVDAKTGKQSWTADFIADAPADAPGFPGERARIQNTRARPSALATDGRTVYLSVFDQSRVVAFDAAAGTRRWAFQTAGWVYGSAVATDRHVYFGSQDDHFYCLDKTTGKQVWKYQTKGRIESGGAVDESFVYFGSCDGGVYCLSQADGKLRWRFDADPKPDGKRSAIYSVPLLRGTRVTFGAGEGQVYGVDRDTGKLRWKVRPSDRSEVYSSAATDGTYFFLSTRAVSKGQGESSLVAIGLK